jgi:hypothetical protein
VSKEPYPLAVAGGSIRGLYAKDSTGAEYLMLARFYDIDRRVYVIQFISLKSAEPGVDEKAARYFDSFQVVRTP